MTDQFDDDAFNFVICPICCEVFQGPVLQCVWGHSFCGEVRYFTSDYSERFFCTKHVLDDLGIWFFVFRSSDRYSQLLIVICSV